MIYFCAEILPLIVALEPDVKLRIIGSSPTPEIAALASDRVEVLGFVPETKPFLETSVISIAPLRFGGLRGVLHEYRADGGRDHAPLRFVGVGQRVAHEVHAAALPGGLEHLGSSGLDPQMGVGDDQLHTPQAAPHEASQEL